MKQNDDKNENTIIYHSQLLDGKLFCNSPFRKGGCELITID